MKKYVYKPYDEVFPELFLQEKSRLLEVLGEGVDIQHVGSTAIPGLGGKGIIDIAIAVEDVQSVIPKVEALGYIFRESGSVPERWFFRIDLPDLKEGTRRYHLHLTFPESIEWKRLVKFRDYLIAHPDVAKEYADLKEKSAEESSGDGALYREKKFPFCESVMAKALD